jgi:hypothetical protein
MTNSAEPITLVMMAKALALGGLSLGIAAEGGYSLQGGPHEIERGPYGLDGALAHFDEIMELTQCRAPTALEGMLPDAVLETIWAPRLLRNPAAILSLVDYFTGTHRARTFLLAQPWGPVPSTPVNLRLSHQVYPVDPGPVFGVFTMRELLHEELRDLLARFDELEKVSAMKATSSMLQCIDAMTHFTRQLKADLGMSLSERVEGSVQ